ncbi:MAG: hypothetical protein FWG07_00330 [Treponema sp.]|nr:hypothetical protein [Treponema sp.]
MKNSPLMNMIPLESNSMEVEFKDICEYIYIVTHCSAFDNEDIRSSLKKGISEVLHIFGQKFKPTRISERAFLSCINGIKINLLNSKMYKEWYKKRKDPIYEPLFFEHIVPLGSIIERCKECGSINEIKTTLSELEFVIITKEEDDILNKSKYKEKGRETLEKAEKIYNECDIKLKTIT